MKRYCEILLLQQNNCHNQNSNIGSFMVFLMHCCLIYLEAVSVLCIPLNIDIFSDVATPGGLLHPLLLPKIYPPLFTLYALYNEKEDSNYWKRVNHWNKQSDMGLMSSLGVDQYVKL